MSEVISPQALSDYMSRFIGFGCPTAPVWFIGLEQGGGESLVELQRRVSAWQESGAGELADLRDHCERIGEHRWHGPRPRIQPTLGKLVRLLLAAQRQVVDTESVRYHQAEKFGCASGESVIADLMPLPSRNVSTWIYSSLIGVPDLESRESYLRRYRPKRVALLREAIHAASPKAVVFIGSSETNTWAEIAGAAFAEGSEGAAWARVGPTRFVVLTHPTAYGSRNAYFEDVGRSLASPSHD